MDSPDRAPLVVDDSVAERLRSALGLDAGTAERVREATPARRRPRRQVGPSADYGSEGEDRA